MAQGIRVKDLEQYTGDLNRDDLSVPVDGNDFETAKRITGRQLKMVIDGEKQEAIDQINASVGNVNDAVTEAIDQINQSAGIQDIYNVTVKVPLPSGYYTSEAARPAVPAEIRKPGLVITYSTAAGVWKTEQFTGENTADWAVEEKWKDFGGAGGSGGDGSFASITEKVAKTLELATQAESAYFTAWGGFYGWSSISQSPAELNSVTFHVFNDDTADLTKVRLIIALGGWTGKVNADNILTDTVKDVAIAPGESADIAFTFDKPLNTNKSLITVAYVCDKKTRLLSIPTTDYIHASLTDADYRIKVSNRPADNPNFGTLSENNRAAWIWLSGYDYHLSEDEVLNVENRLTRRLPSDYKKLFEGDRQTVEVVNIGEENIEKSKLWYFTSYNAYNGYGQSIGTLSSVSAVSFVVNPDVDPMTKIRCQIRKGSIDGTVLADETLSVNIEKSAITTIDWFFDEVENAEGSELFFMFACDAACGKCGPVATDYPQPAVGMWYSSPVNGLTMQFFKYAAGDNTVVWVKVGDTRYQLNQASLDNIAERLGLTPASYRICLPDKIPAVVGDTLQLFTRGFVQAINPYELDIWTESAFGRRKRYFEFTPNAAGEMPFDVTIRDVSGNIQGTKTCTIDVKAVVKSPATLKVAGSLGDSNSMGGVWQGEMLRRLVGSGGTPAGNSLTNITFRGSVSKTYSGITYGFDGIGGTTWDYWAGENSPYWDSSINGLNFKKYVDAYMGGQVDIMYCMLGWNGITSRQKDFSQWIAYGKKIVDNMHSYYPSMKFVLTGIQLPNLNFAGDATKNREDWVGMLEAIFNMNDAYQSWCNEAGYKDFMQFLNISSVVDSENNSLNTTKAVNTRNTETEVVGMDNVHLSASGYYQIADACYRNFVANFCQ